jgi:hypothetical protein
MTLKSFVAAGVGCGLCTVPAVMSQESDAALPIRAEVIITDESPRFLEKDGPDSPVRLTPIKVAEKGRYGAQEKFYGCTPDQTGQCKAQVLYVLLDSQGHQRFTSGWLRLWYDRPPPPQGEFRIGEEGMGGEIGGDPPGSWEILSIVRDQVSGLMSVSAASLQVPAPLLPVGGSGASHCHKDESVLFSCRTGAKQISVCSSPDFLRKTGYLPTVSVVPASARKWISNLRVQTRQMFSRILVAGTPKAPQPCSSSPPASSLTRCLARTTFSIGMDLVWW